MRTTTATATVTSDGKMVVPVPSDIPQGTHEVVVILDERIPAKEVSANQTRDRAFPVHDLGPWPEQLSLSRKDLYDDWQR